MAFASPAAYTAGEKAKVKADIDEVSKVISDLIVYIQARNGKFTHAEQELTRIKETVDLRSAALV